MWPYNMNNVRIVPEFTPTNDTQYKWKMSVEQAFNYDYLTKEGWEGLIKVAKEKGVDNDIIAWTVLYEETVERIRKNVLDDLETKYVYMYPYTERKAGEGNYGGYFMSLHPDRRSYYLSLREACEYCQWGYESE